MLYINFLLTISIRKLTPAKTVTDMVRVTFYAYQTIGMHADWCACDGTHRMEEDKT